MKSNTFEYIVETPTYGIYRMKVPKGWLVCMNKYDSCALCFIPDEKTEWEIKEVSK